jgi:hypothetical protein
LFFALLRSHAYDSAFIPEHLMLLNSDKESKRVPQARGLVSVVVSGISIPMLEQKPGAKANTV